MNCFSSVSLGHSRFTVFMLPRHFPQVFVLLWLLHLAQCWMRAEISLVGYWLGGVRGTDDPVICFCTLALSSAFTIAYLLAVVVTEEGSFCLVGKLFSPCLTQILPFDEMEIFWWKSTWPEACMDRRGLEKRQPGWCSWPPWAEILESTLLSDP